MRVKEKRGLAVTSMLLMLITLMAVGFSSCQMESSFEAIDAADVEARGIRAAVDWQPGTYYAVNTYVNFRDAVYKIIQAHTAQADWQPPIVPALFVRVVENNSSYIEWQPGVCLFTNDKVLVGEDGYKVLQGAYNSSWVETKIYTSSFSTSGS